MPFIVFEGLDGAGKSTQIQILSEFLEEKKLAHCITREPGGTDVGEQLREILLRPSAPPLVSKTEVLLYEAIRAQHVAELIQPSLKKGLWVLCDRFTASTVAFQAGGRGLSEDDIEYLNDFASGGLRPDLTILLDISLALSESRREQRQAETGTEADRFESEKRHFHEQVRYRYLQQAQIEQWLVLDAELPSEKIAQRIQAALRERRWLES